MNIGIIAAAGLLAAAVVQPAAAQPMGIGSSPQGTLTYAMAAAFANVLRETANIQARVQPQSGTGVMLPLINSGELDFGFVNTLELSEAYNGTGSHQGRAQRNLRAAAVMMPIQVGIFVRNDSPIRRLEDLRGRRIAQGFTAQAVIQTVLTGVLANGGLTPADIRPVQVPNLIRGVDEFIAGNADAAFFALGQAKVAEADAAVGGIRFIPLSTDAAAVARMRQVVAPSYIGVVQPAANLPGVREPLPTMFYDYVMVVNASLPPARVQALLTVLHDERDRLAAAVPIFRQQDNSRLYGRTDVPFHEGALAFFRARNIAQVQ
jgi:TRAP transporter TAXI family solute receptor